MLKQSANRAVSGFGQQVGVVPQAYHNVGLVQTDVIKQRHFPVMPQVEAAHFVEAGIEKRFHGIGVGIPKDQDIRQFRPVRLNYGLGNIAAHIGGIGDRG